MSMRSGMPVNGKAGTGRVAVVEEEARLVPGQEIAPQLCVHHVQPGRRADAVAGAGGHDDPHQRARVRSEARQCVVGAPPNAVWSGSPVK